MFYKNSLVTYSEPLVEKKEMKSAIIFPLVVFAEETRAKTGLEAERDYSGMLFANKLKIVINQINVM